MVLAICGMRIRVGAGRLTANAHGCRYRWVVVFVCVFFTKDPQVILSFLLCCASMSVLWKGATSVTPPTCLLKLTGKLILCEFALGFLYIGYNIPYESIEILNV